MSDRYEETNSFPEAPIDRRDSRQDHPENDLSDDADYSNRTPPEPQSFDELADSPDPLARAEANRRSSRQAWQYLLLAVVTSIGFAILLAFGMRMFADPSACADFGGRLMCSQSQQQWWAIIASLPPIGFLIGTMVIMIRKLNRYLRWRPWMGVFWVMVPFTMWCLTVTVQVYLAPSAAF